MRKIVIKHVNIRIKKFMNLKILKSKVSLNLVNYVVIVGSLFISQDVIYNYKTMDEG